MARKDHDIRNRQGNRPGWGPKIIEYCHDCGKEEYDLDGICETGNTIQIQRPKTPILASE